MMDGAHSQGDTGQDDIAARKQDHIDLVLDQQANAPVHGHAFDGIRFEHDALPELDYGDIDLTTEFLGFHLKRPFLISSMTGGPARAETINRNLAVAASETGVAMGVGSQRIALEGGAAAGLARSVRADARGVPLFSNLGAAQLVDSVGRDGARRAVDMLEADALILHLNPLQELLQPGGDRNWARIGNEIEALVKTLSVPVIVKEVGFGLSARTARKLSDLGVAALDVAGRGGTNFSRVELARQKDPSLGRVGANFVDWGLTTPECLRAIRRNGVTLPLIASGGIRNGLDGAKALGLGADLFAQAGPILQAALESADTVIRHIRDIDEALRFACFLTGTQTPQGLKNAVLDPS